MERLGLLALISPSFWTLFLSEWSLLVLSSFQAGAAMFLLLLLGAMAQQLLRVAPSGRSPVPCPGSPGGRGDSSYCPTETWVMHSSQAPSA